MTKNNTLKIFVSAFWATALFCAAIFCCVRIAGGNAFESNIMVLVPSTDEARPQLAEDTNLQKGFLVLIKHPDRNVGRQLATEFHDTLVSQAGVEKESDPAALLESLRQFFHPYRYQLLSREMQEKLSTQSPDVIAEEALRALYSPVQGLQLYSLSDDPFNLGGTWFQRLYPQAAQISPEIIPALTEGENTWYLVRARLQDSPFSISSQSAVIPVVEDFRQLWPDAMLVTSGFVFHAAEATATARGEISTVGLGSLLGIALLVVIVFRSGRAVLAIITTLTGSVLFALAGSLVVFDQIHLITLAFGSTLLGLSVDYCFHFLVKSRRLGSGSVAGRLIAKGLAISAGSSILVYLMQLFSPFPGLRQFAVFVMFGLLGAWFTIVFLTFWYQDSPHQKGFRELALYRLVQSFYLSAASRKTLVISLSVLIICAAGLQIFRSGFSDDIRLLNTSSNTLIADEIQVMSLLGGIDTQRYWTVVGENQQQVLQSTEQLVSVLRPDIQVMAVSDLIPSQQQQQQNHQLVMEKLYGPDGALEKLCALMTTDCTLWQDGDFSFRSGLTPDVVPPIIAGAFPVFAVSDPKHSIVLPLQGQQLDGDRTFLFPGANGVSFVDRVGELSDTMAGFRIQVSWLLALFLLVFSIACLLLYRTKGIAVVSSVFISLCAAVALSSPDAITLFHVLALLLVTGLTIDAAIFYRELGFNSDSWLAASLATATSILAFGLLALSSVPVLQQFGVIVASGLACAWLVTPLFHLLVKSGSFEEIQ